MKDLILITAYCPDDYRENVLRKLVNSLEKYKEVFEVMIVSHTAVPVDIQKKVEYCFYDKKNEILTDWDLLNQPWFSPQNDRRILSSFLSKKNTHLAIWRMLCIGFSTANNLGYSKVHHIEYDCEIKNIDEFKENSDLLNSYDSIIYISHQTGIEELPFGGFQSYKVEEIDPILLELDENKIKNMIRESSVKSPEKMLLDLLQKKGRVFIKDKEILDKNGNRFGIVDGQVSKEMNPWSVPYYDHLTKEINFIVWNTTKPETKHVIIVNDQNLFVAGPTHLNHWSILSLGKIEEIKSIVVLEDNKIRDTFYLETQGEKEIFKKMSFSY